MNKDNSEISGNSKLIIKVDLKKYWNLLASIEFPSGLT